MGAPMADSCDAGQKTTKSCKATILQFKKIFFKASKF